ncbi:hypothetical protein Tco_1312863 [Tanacetum coccineum]
MLLPKEDNVNTGKQGLGFENKNDVENPSLLNKAKELVPSLYNIDEMGKELLSEEELKREAKKRLKVKQRKSPLSYHGFVYGETQFEEPPKVPLKRRNVNLKKYLKQAKLNDLKYVTFLEDEFDEKCLILDIQQEFFKTQFKLAILESHSHVYENKMFEQNSSLENENRCLKKTITELLKQAADVKEEMTKRWAQYEKDFSQPERHSISLELKSQNKSSTSVQNGQGKYASGPEIEIDYSQFTYGPKQTQPSETESQSSEINTCESNISAEPSELVTEPDVNESNVESQPKVWSDAPIIEEYESDSEDECVSILTKQQETPSFANQQVKTPRENVKRQFTHSQKPKVDKKDLGYGFAVRACFVCGSLNHLIRDCDFHEKRMARKAELNNGWNNVQRVNKQNQFVPSAVLTRTGIIPVNTARTSSTKNFSTARQSVNRQTVLTKTAMKVNTVKPIVNRVRPANVFHKTHSPTTRPFKKTTVLRQIFSNQKLNTAKVNEVSTVGGKRETAVKSSAEPKEKRNVASGCSRPHDWKQAYLAEFQDLNVGPAVTTDDKRAGPREEEQVFMDDLERLKGKKRDAYRSLKLSGRTKASSTNLLNNVSLPVSTASPPEGLSLSDPTNPEEDDSEYPHLRIFIKIH